MILTILFFIYLISVVIMVPVTVTWADEARENSLDGHFCKWSIFAIGLSVVPGINTLMTINFLHYWWQRQ